jgi:hypothetical protein
VPFSNSIDLAAGAAELFEALLGFAGPWELFSEEADPGTGPCSETTPGP